MSVADLEANNYDEIFMQQSMIFADSLQDLKNLRKQLYSAAEYFEDSFTNGGEKQFCSVIDTLKDYAVKAFLNTVDHLGSVTTKVNELVDSKAEEVFESKIMVFCVEQRLRTYQGYSDQQGVSQQTLVIRTPKYHKRYILPAGQSAYGPKDHILSDKRDHRQPVQAPSYTPPVRMLLEDSSLKYLLLQKPCQEIDQIQKNDRFLLSNIHYYYLDLYILGHQLPNQLGHPFQSLLLIRNSFLPNRGSPCQ